MADVLSGASNLASLPQHQEDDHFEPKEIEILNNQNLSTNVNTINDIISMNKQNYLGYIMNENPENYLGKASAKRKMILDSSQSSSNASPDNKKTNINDSDDIGDEDQELEEDDVENKSSENVFHVISFHVKNVFHVKRLIISKLIVHT